MHCSSKQAMWSKTMTHFQIPNWDNEFGKEFYILMNKSGGGVNISINCLRYFCDYLEVGNLDLTDFHIMLSDFSCNTIQIRLILFTMEKFSHQQTHLDCTAASILDQQIIKRLYAPQSEQHEEVYFQTLAYFCAMMLHNTHNCVWLRQQRLQKCMEILHYFTLC